MELLPYDEFSALRLGQFLPEGAKTGWYSCDRKIWRCADHETFGSYTVFCFADEEHTTLSGIVSALETDLGADGAGALLRTLRLPIELHATVDNVLDNLPKPDYRALKSSYDDLLFYRFTVGSRWPYELGLHIQPTGGVAKIYIGRGDMLVPDEDE